MLQENQKTPSPEVPKVRALILAGSRRKHDAVAMAGGKSLKAFVEVGGVPMIERVIRTLLETRCCDTITISLPEMMPLQGECPQLFTWLQAGTVCAVAPAASPAESVLRELQRAPEDALHLVTTGDHPLLTSAMVHTFLEALRGDPAEVAAALVDTRAILQRYPTSRRTALRFADGPRSGCNLFAFRGRKASSVIRFWRRMETLRKHPLKMASALGPGTLLLYTLGRLTLDAALTRLGGKLGVRLLAVPLGSPEAGIDVDTPEDLQLVQKIFASAAAPSPLAD